MKDKIITALTAVIMVTLAAAFVAIVVGALALLWRAVS